MFHGKYAAVLSTSINFFDHTAHAYMRAVCDDLGMRFAGAFSVEMGDLLEEEERGRLLGFAEQFFDRIAKGAPSQRQHNPLPETRFLYRPGKAAEKVTTEGRRVVLLSDHKDGSSNLAKMVNRMGEIFVESAKLVNLNEIDIKGGAWGASGAVTTTAAHTKGRTATSTRTTGK